MMRIAAIRSYLGLPSENDALAFLRQATSIIDSNFDNLPEITPVATALLRNTSPGALTVTHTIKQSFYLSHASFNFLKAVPVLLRDSHLQRQPNLRQKVGQRSAVTGKSQGVKAMQLSKLERHRVCVRANPSPCTLHPPCFETLVVPAECQGLHCTSL